MVAGSLATLMMPVGLVQAAMTSPPRPIFSWPLNESPVVARFTRTLCREPDVIVPSEMRHAIDVGLGHPAVKRPDRRVERLRAEFLTELMMDILAPRYLRFAGFDDLAAACEAEIGQKGKRSACWTVRDILGVHVLDGVTPVPPKSIGSSVAGAADYANLLCLFASGDDCTHDAIETYSKAGEWAARSLIQPARTDSPQPRPFGDAAEQSWLWAFAARAINDAIPNI